MAKAIHNLDDLNDYIASVDEEAHDLFGVISNNDEAVNEFWDTGHVKLTIGDRQFNINIAITEEGRTKP